MAIHLLGEISFQDLINEFKVPKPVSLAQMYAGAGYVPEANAGVPKSGAISLGNFYGATAALVIDYNITADMFNFNSSTVLANSNWDGVTPVILTVNIANDIVVSGNSTSTPAFVVNALPSGSQVFINNNGFIVGMGGAGGSYNVNGGVGGAGGVGLRTYTPTTINNRGTIAGGGGGGGANIVIGGHGGRSGRKNSDGGTVGTFNSAGSSEYGGAAGGDWGADGQSVFAGGMSGGAGGAGGAAVDGNSLINWVSLGTVMGSRLN